MTIALDELKDAIRHYENGTMMVIEARTQGATQLDRLLKAARGLIDSLEKQEKKPNQIVLDVSVPGLIVYGSYELRCVYKNWKGVTSNRRLGVMSFWCGESQYHKNDGEQWFMHALDLDKMGARDFAVKDMSFVTLHDKGAQDG